MTAAIYAPVDVIWQRILARTVVRPDGCWLWRGATNSRGYGCIASGKRSKSILTHQIAVLASGRELPDGMTVDHSCHDSRECTEWRECLHRRCVNPAHLVVMTAGDNTRRRFGYERCPRGHKYATRNDGVRRCSHCAADYNAARRSAQDFSGRTVRELLDDMFGVGA